MDKNEFDIVKAILCDKLGVKEDIISMDTHLRNDLGADSLDSVEIMMELEKEFNFSIPDDVAEKINTVGDAVKLVSERFSLHGTNEVKSQ